MNKDIEDIIAKISSNRYNLFKDNEESLYYSLFPNDSNIDFEEQINSIESFFPLFEEINKKQEKNTSDESSSNKINFVIDKKCINKKRGRKAKEKNKNKFHDNACVDNLLRKIQIHFFNFVINFCNDALKEEYPNSKAFFKSINCKCKKNVKYSYTSSLKKATIKYLLRMDISIKNKKSVNSYNRALLEKIEKFSPSLSKLFEINYLELFEKYYNKGNPLDKIVFENLNVNLSEKTKTFYNLIDKNKNLKKHLIDMAEKEYICVKKDSKE